MVGAEPAPAALVPEGAADVGPSDVGPGGEEGSPLLVAEVGGPDGELGDGGSADVLAGVLPGPHPVAESAIAMDPTRATEWRRDASRIRLLGRRFAPGLCIRQPYRNPD